MALTEQVERALLSDAPVRRRGRALVVVGLLVVPLLLLGTAVVVVVRGAAEQSTAAAARPVVAVAPVLGHPRAVAVHIPHLSLDSQLESLDIQSDGELAAPVQYGVAGWWEQGTVPGEVGPAVIAGHVDSRSGPAVFYGLHTLVPGDRVVVDRDDGTSVSFAVNEVRTVPKKKFPTADVYGATSDAELRLVTCGGVFDRRSGSYESNTVVFATLVP